MIVLKMATKSINLVFISFLIAGATSKYCYWNTRCPYKYLSSETPYDLVRGDIRDNVLKIEGCHPVSIWSLFRHGEKNPDEKSRLRMRDVYSLRDDILSAYRNGKSGLCAQDLQNLIEWKWDDPVVTSADKLKPEGYTETLNLGKRLKEVFSDIFATLDKESYEIHPTDGVWNSESARALVEGLTGSPSKLNVEPLGVSTYSSCKNYVNDVLLNLTYYKEAHKFQNSAEFSTVRDSILSRTGIEYPLSAENITSLYELCRRFWSNAENKPSPWCAIFNTEDLRVLEYVGDLTTYYGNSYGGPRNGKLGGRFLADLYSGFDEVKNGNGKRFVAHFSDSPLVGMVAAALGLYKDGAPLPGERRVVDRKWRSSTILPLGANFLAVMHRCTHDQHQDYKIVFYLNEERLNLCSEGWCAWEDFQKKFEPFSSINLDFCD